MRVSRTVLGGALGETPEVYSLHAGIRRGSFSSVKDLVQKIDHFVSQYNKTCSPFL